MTSLKLAAGMPLRQLTLTLTLNPNFSTYNVPFATENKHTASHASCFGMSAICNDLNIDSGRKADTALISYNNKAMMIRLC